jgi:hypothetical protein
MTMTDKQKELVEMAERAASLTDAFLTHATQAVSQYDSLCRNMAAEILCLRHALNRCAQHADLKILHEQTRCSVCLTSELRMAEKSYLDAVTTLTNLQDAVRTHRDARGDDRCWKDDEDLYACLPEGFTPPERDSLVELANCERYIASRQHPATIYVSPEREIEQLRARVDNLTDKAIRFDVDAVGIETREQESTELVDRRAQVHQAFGILQSIMGIDLIGDDPDDLVPALRTLQVRLNKVIKTLDLVQDINLNTMKVGLETLTGQLNELTDLTSKRAACRHQYWDLDQCIDCGIHSNDLLNKKV